MRLKLCIASVFLTPFLFIACCVSAMAELKEQDNLAIKKIAQQIEVDKAKMEKLVELYKIDPSDILEFNWIFLNFEGDFSDDLKNKIIENFKKYYMIYLKKNDIPKEKIMLSKGAWIGYVDGCECTLGLKRINNNEIEFKFDMIWGNVGGRGAERSFVWDGKDWKPTERLNTVWMH